MTRELLERAPFGLGESDYEPDLVFAFSARRVREDAVRSDGTRLEACGDGACVWASARDAEEAMRFYIPESGVFPLALETAKHLARVTGRRALVLVDGECYEIRRWPV